MSDQTTARTWTPEIEQLIARMRRWLEPSKDDESRCAICGWELRDSIEAGCVRGNCSSRPFPQRWFAPERAKREYGPSLVEPNLAPLTFNMAVDDVRFVLAALLAERDRLCDFCKQPYRPDDAITRSCPRCTQATGEWIQELHDQLKAERDRPTPTAWQPIETCPLDGRFVLLGWFDIKGMPVHHIGRWNDVAERWSDGQSKTRWRSPTHWHPLTVPSASAPAAPPATPTATLDRKGRGSIGKARRDLSEGSSCRRRTARP